MFKPFLPVTPGQPLSASELNRWAAEIERQTRMTVAPPLELVSDGGGVRLRYVGAERFVAELTAKVSTVGSGSGCLVSGGGSGSGSGSSNWRRYSWRKMVDNTCGGFITDPNSLNGTYEIFPAFEINGRNTPLSTNGHATRVTMWPGIAGDSFFFEYWGPADTIQSGSGSGTVRQYVSNVQCSGGSLVVTYGDFDS